MKWDKPYFISLALMYVFHLSGLPTSTAQPLLLSGYVEDIYSHTGIEGVSFYALVDTKRKKISESGREGSFSIEYPKGGVSLIVEKKGYRTLAIATESPLDSVEKVIFFLRLPLIPLDMQVHDKPYMQSEQEDFVLDTRQTNQKTLTRIFKTTNALTGEPIHSAKICLNYTKVEKKDCRTLSPDSSTQKVIFLEADIVNVVVESTGYQPYRGNLILDKMDGSTGMYDIKLTPEITVLTMNIKNYPPEINCQLIALEGDTIFMSKVADKSYYTFGKTGEYSILIRNSQGEKLHSEKVLLVKGLNLRTITLDNSWRTSLKKTPPKPAAPARPIPVVDATPLSDSIKNISVYFVQSNFHLLPESCHVLDQLVVLLQHRPKQKISIEGHTDNVGDPYRNETLSEYRARITLRYLEERGIQASRMEWRGLGSRKPVVGNDTEEQKIKNRRVEIILLPE